MRLRRLPDGNLQRGRPLPDAVQWHLLTGFAAGFILLVGGLAALGAVETAGLPLPTLAAAFLVVLSGAARAFLGGSGRLHLAAVVIALPVFAANLYLLVTR